MTTASCSGNGQLPASDLHLRSRTFIGLPDSAPRPGSSAMRRSAGACIARAIEVPRIRMVLLMPYVLLSTAMRLRARSPVGVGATRGVFWICRVPLFAFLRLVKITTMSFDPAAALVAPICLPALYSGVSVQFSCTTRVLDDLAWDRLGNTCLLYTSPSPRDS